MEEKFSEGYKVLCRFFKEIGLYKEFIDFQRKETINIPVDTNNPVKALGNTSITYWIKKNKKIDFPYRLYEVFKLYLLELFPTLWQMYGSKPVLNANLTINKEGKKIYFTWNKI